MSVRFSRAARLARMQEIGLIYDKEDEELLLQHTWTVDADGYVVTRSKYADDPYWLRVHRLLMGKAPEGYCIDHINRNPLDNRRSNLRMADASLSNVNRTFFTDETDVRNIQKVDGSFLVKIARDSVMHYVGRYPTLDLARAARNGWIKGYDAREHTDRDNSITPRDTDDATVGQACERQDSPSCDSTRT